jgi:hypothetical protein
MSKNLLHRLVYIRILSFLIEEINLRKKFKNDSPNSIFQLQLTIFLLSIFKILIVSFNF